MEIKAGSVIISSAGHDKGRLMLVVGVDGERVLVADGKERRLNAPKKKNIKHIQGTSALIEPDGLTDKKLRQTLKAMGEKPQSTLQESE
ncbi:MAG: KOW domain-containing RNA-binding protein [Oscillospiraceae bacterium]|nr:KOW domain-containing RNA-binding protein [Oscillospiraceae bacterium]